MADHSVRIEQIQNILRAGATSVTVDGVTTTFDFASLRRELRQLMADDDVHQDRRPVISSFDLTRSF